MQRLNINKLLKCKYIYLKGNNYNPLRDRYLYIADNFLIVGKNENDTAPTWFNVDQIARLEGVEEVTAPPGRTGARVAFF